MERWYWIELIGFDNESPDYGVENFLARNVTTIGVSLLFSHVDFIFQNQDEPLLPTACSYGGHEYNRERRRQEWTSEQLRGLVRTLQNKGVKVFISSLDLTENITDPLWLYYGRNGKPINIISPIKPIGKGRYVGDEVIDKLSKAIDYYNFDGLQIADGISSNRLSIEAGDFSLSFCADSGIDIPKKLMTDDAENYGARREWILKYARAEWTRFICDRWAAFYDKLFATVKKPIMFNNAWTRDSFEAYYRYGLDYRRCHVEDAFAVMVEENSATRAITSSFDEGGVEFPISHRTTFTYEYALMQQNIRLTTKGLRQISLTPISDTMEQWDALRHCPTELARSIVRRYNNFVYRNGKFEACSDAPLYCLSDCIPSNDWEWLATIEGYRIPLPDRVEGFAAICNPEGLYSEFEHFLKTKNYFGAALLKDLVMGGLNLGVQLTLSDIENFKGANCFLVTDLHTYTEEQKHELTKSQLPLVVIGEQVDLPLDCSARYDGEYISVAVYKAKGIAPDFDSLKAYEKIIEAKPSEHAEIWTEELSCRRVEEEFFTQLCRILNTAFSADRSRDPKVKAVSYLCGNDKYILLSNDEYTYNICTVDTSTSISSATALMKYKGYNVQHDDRSFTVRIPPRCVEIVRIGSNKTDN